MNFLNSVKPRQSGRLILTFLTISYCHFVPIHSNLYPPNLHWLRETKPKSLCQLQRQLLRPNLQQFLRLQMRNLMR